MMVSAILLAAGESRRMGEANKLLLPFRGAPLIHSVARAIEDCGVGEWIAVTGHEAGAVAAALQDFDFKLVNNVRYSTGMTSSIQVGVAAASAQAKGYMICLSDLPYLTAEVLDQLLRAFEAGWEKDPRLIVIPTHQGRRGHPLIFSKHYKKALLEHRNKEGCKGVVVRHPSHHVLVEVNSDGILKDVDRPDEYEDLLRKD
ncbi:MAG: nucleotidyltransferase family protein [Bacteroidota bacterium]